MKITLVCVTGTHRKFWTVQVVRNTVTCSWGRIGEWTAFKAWGFRSAGLAEDFASRRMDSKLRKGYDVLPAHLKAKFAAAMQTAEQRAA